MRNASDENLIACIIERRRKCPVLSREYFFFFSTSPSWHPLSKWYDTTHNPAQDGSDRSCNEISPPIHPLQRVCMQRTTPWNEQYYLQLMYDSLMNSISVEVGEGKGWGGWSIVSYKLRLTRNKSLSDWMAMGGWGRMFVAGMFCLTAVHECISRNCM